MFTGIIEEVGTIASMQRGARSCVLTIKARVVLADAHVGDSIAVNGTCLTVTSFSADRFTADVMNETLERSSLARLRPGAHVNLERAMPAGGRFGGHIVSGHIDGVGTVTSVRADGNAVWYTIAAPRSVLRLIVEKGSIVIDGISLTVARVSDADFSVSVIPHTREATNLGGVRVGDVVNLENDVVGKYVERLLGAGGEADGTCGVADGTSGATGNMRGVADGMSGALGSLSVSGASDAPSTPSTITREFLLENGF